MTIYKIHDSYFKTHGAAERYFRKVRCKGPTWEGYLEKIKGKTLRDFYGKDRPPIDLGNLDRALDELARMEHPSRKPPSKDLTPVDYGLEEEDALYLRRQGGYFDEGGIVRRWELGEMLEVYHQKCYSLWDLEEVKRVCKEIGETEAEPGKGPELVFDLDVWGKRERPFIDWLYGDKLHVLANCECWKHFAKHWILKSEMRWERAASSPVPRPYLCYVGRSMDGKLRLFDSCFPVGIMDRYPYGENDVVTEIEVLDE